MNLTPDILYYLLSRTLDIQYIKKPDSKIMVGRPVFFSQRRTCLEKNPISRTSDTIFSRVQNSTFTNALVIVTEKQQKKNSVEHYSQCVFLCLGEPPEFTMCSDCAVFSAEETIPVSVIFNAVQELYNYFDAWEAEMDRITRQDRGFEELLNCCESVLYEPICILDNELKYVSYSHNSYYRGLVTAYVTQNQGVPNEIIDEFIQMSRNTAFNSQVEPFLQKISIDDGDMIIKNLFYQDGFIGRLVLPVTEYDEAQFRYHCDVMTIISGYVEAMYGKFCSFRQQKMVFNYFRSTLSECIRKNSTENVNWNQILQDVGWKLSDTFQLLQFSPKPRYDNSIYSSYIIEEIEEETSGCICFQDSDKLFLLVDHSRLVPFNQNSFYQNLACFLRDHLIVAGVSREFCDLNDLLYAYKQTIIALEIGTDIDPTMWYFKFGCYALNYILLKGTQEFLNKPEMLCSPKLLILLKTDHEKNTQYYKTLYTYFQCKWNASAAANTLFIHRSTFINRMERLQKLAGIAFDSPDELLYLSISFKILENYNLKNGK